MFLWIWKYTSRAVRYNAFNLSGRHQPSYTPFSWANRQHLMNKDPLPTTHLHNPDIFLGGRFAKYIDLWRNIETTLFNRQPMDYPGFTMALCYVCHKNRCQIRQTKRHATRFVKERYVDRKQFWMSSGTSRYYRQAAVIYLAVTYVPTSGDHGSWCMISNFVHSKIIITYFLLSIDHRMGNYKRVNHNMTLWERYFLLIVAFTSIGHASLEVWVIT